MAIAICGPNTKVVPGDGPVSTRADVIAHRDMLAAVRDQISSLVKQGKSEDSHFKRGWAGVRCPINTFYVELRK